MVRRFVLLLSLFFAFPLFAIELPKEKERWSELRLDGFTIYSNAGDVRTVELAEKLQRMRQAMARATRLKVDAPLETQVFLFRNEANIRPYLEAVFGKSKNSAGAFLSHTDGNYMLIDGEAEAKGENVVTHELTHFFLNNSFPGAPVWFHEGVAEFYGAFEIDGKRVKIGGPIASHISFLRSQKLMPLRELFAITPKSKDYNEGLRQGVFYAQSWAFVHYGLLGPRREQLGRFVDLLNAGKERDAAFREAFGADYELIDRELQAYVRQVTMPGLTFSFEELPATGIDRPTVLSRSDLLLHIGDFLVHSGPRNFPDAEVFLEESVKLDPAQGAALALLGFIAEQEGKTAEAVKRFEAATAAGSKSHLTYLLAGEHELRRLHDGARAGVGAPKERVERARQLFRQSIALRPALARGYAGLGATYLVDDGDLTPGIEALEKSWSMAPSQFDVAYNLAVLYGREGEREKALLLIDHVLNRAEDPDLQRQARESLLVADYNRAQALFQKGKMEEGEKLLRGIREQTTNETLRGAVDGELARVAQFVGRQREFELFNAALEKAKKEDFSGALKLVDELLATGKDEEVLKNAREMRTHLVRLQKK